MKKHSGMMLKFFLCFLLIAFISFFLLEFQRSFDVNNNADKDNQVANIASSSADFKIKNVKDYFEDFKNKLSSIWKDKFVETSVTNITKAYSKLALGFSDELVAALTKELHDIYSRVYSPEMARTLTPGEKNDIIAQASSMRSDIGNRELFNALVQDDNVKHYVVIEKNITDFIEKNLEGVKLKNIILTDPKGKIVYAYGKKIELGRNVYNDGFGEYSVSSFDNGLFPRGVSSANIKFYETVGALSGNAELAVVATQSLKNGGIGVAYLDNKGLNERFAAFSSMNNEKNVSHSTYLINKNGKIIASAETGNKELGKIALSESDLMKYAKTPSGYYKSAARGAVSYNLSSTPLNAFDLEWKAVSAVFYKDAASVSAILRYIIVFIIVAFISWLLAALITRPWKRMRDIFVKVAEGDMEIRATASAKDESRDMVNAFNAVVDRLYYELQANLSNKLILQNEMNGRKLVEAKLKEEHNFFTSILNSRGIVLIVIDEANRIVRINNSLMQIFDDKYMIGNDVMVAIPAQYTEEVLRDIKRTRTTKEMTLLSTISVRNGEEIYIDWTFSFIEGLDGKENFVAGIGLNVTEKYKTKQTLQENREILQIIMSHAQDAIIVSNDEDNIVIVNEAAEKMLGYSFAELIGKPVIPLVIPEEYKDEFIEDIKNGMTLEVYATNKKGDRFPIELSISKVEVLGKWNSLYIIRDASIRKKRETEIVKALEKAKSAEKTKSEFLANMSHEIRTPLNGIIGFLNLLKQTPMNKTQLEYLNIINSSSDSLLNIINDILDFSKIESGKMTLETIEFNATEVFEQVTELYAAKANEKNINLIVMMDQKVPEWLVGDQLRVKQILSNLLSNAIKFTNSGGCITLGISVESCDDKKCMLRISVKDTGIGISKEKQSLIFEAFSQADSSVTRKYGGSGLGLSICVRIAKLMGGSGLQLNSDEGQGSEFFFTAPFDIGINTAKEKPVFNDVSVALFDCSDSLCPFCMACHDYLDIFRCKVMVFTDFDEFKALGKVDIVCMGYREADSELLKSISEYAPEKPTIYLACGKDAVGLKNRESKTVRVLNQPLNISKFLDAFTFLIRKNTTITHEAVDKKTCEEKFTGHVLVVEDNAVNRRLADIILRQFGLTVELAINGKEALNMFLKNKYDIIFMDIHMPVLDGVSATKEIIRIEKDSGLAHTTIVALTANVIQEDRDAYLEAGMDSFLAKPIEKNKLESVLMQYLDSDKAKAMLESLAKIFEIDNIESIKNIVEEFHNVAARQIINMREALNELDMKKLGSIANSLKGAAMNLRLDNIVLAAKRIEGSIEDERDTDYGNIIDDLETEITRIKRLIG